MNTEFVRELRNELDMLEMLQHELELAKDAGDVDDMMYFKDEAMGKELSMFKALSNDICKSHLRKRMDEFRLSKRLRNCLKIEGIVYVGDLVQRTERDMLMIPKFGRVSLDELRYHLEPLGLSFGMELSGWDSEDLD